jgi:hypothetical protein
MDCATFICVPELLVILGLSFCIEEVFMLNYATGTVYDEIPMQVSSYESP